MSRCNKGRLGEKREGKNREGRGRERLNQQIMLHRTVRSRFDRVFIIDKAAAVAAAQRQSSIPDRGRALFRSDILVPIVDVVVVVVIVVVVVVVAVVVVVVLSTFNSCTTTGDCVLYVLGLLGTGGAETWPPIVAMAAF